MEYTDVHVDCGELVVFVSEALEGFRGGEVDGIVRDEDAGHLVEVDEILRHLVGEDLAVVLLVVL